MCKLNEGKETEPVTQCQVSQVEHVGSAKEFFIGKILQPDNCSRRLSIEVLIELLDHETLAQITFIEIYGHGIDPI